MYAHVVPRDRIVLCGDLNTPRRDLPDGSVMTFAYRSNGKLRPERGERWDAAERALVHTLRVRPRMAPLGLSDHSALVVDVTDAPRGHTRT